MTFAARIRLEANEIVRFFTEPTEGYSIALFRVLYGLLAMWTSLFLYPNAERYYTEQGRLPWAKVSHFPEHFYSLLRWAPESAELVYALVTISVVASLLLTVGLFSRVAAAAVFFVQVALQHRNPYVLNSGDHLFLILAFLLMFTPLERRWSLAGWLKGRWRPTHRQKELAQPVAAWAVRLIGLQISYVYLYAFVAKMNSSVWIRGTVMYDVFASPTMARFPAELHWPILLALVAWSTLVFELLFPLLIWQKPFRRYVIPIGMLFHLGIEVTLVLPIFSVLMIISYASFLDDEETRAFVSFLGRPFRRGRAPGVPVPSGTPVASERADS